MFANSRFHMSAFDDPEICRTILESLSVGLCVIDMDKKIVFWSDGAVAVTGHPRHEAVGRSCVEQDSLHCDAAGCEFCGEDFPLARAIKTAQPVDAYGFLHHKHGHEVAVRVHAIPVRNAHGSIIGAVETFEALQPANSLDRREESLNRQGAVDHETEVASQALMQSHLRETMATFSEVQVPFGILCLRLEGLDHFRNSFGPEAVSSLLRVIARSVESALWKTDFVGRWSEDRFLVILNGCGEDSLHSVRDRIRHMMSNDCIEWWGEKRSLPIAIGEAMAQSGDSIDSLLQRAQTSLEASARRITGAHAMSAHQSGS